jgi:putative transposase
VQAAWPLALGRRQPAAGVSQHADRGSPYACGPSQALLAASGMRWSLSRKGDGRDHAVAERVVGRLKGERTSLRHDASRQEAWDEVIDDIAMCYNSKR